MDGVLLFSNSHSDEYIGLNGSGTGRADESPGEAGPCQEAVGPEPQGGGEAGEGGGAPEPAGVPAGAAGGAHPQDRP